MKRLLVVPALALALALSACGLSKTNSGGWIVGDGHVEPIAAGDRGNPVDLTGTTLEGDAFDLASTRGQVTVINVWGAWCAACLDEASKIEAAHQQLGDDVAFLGVDIRDTSTDQALAYQRNYGITYPSIYSPDGKATLAFASVVSPRTIPATIILDPTGRPATIIRGAVPTTLTLVEAVQDVEKESSSSPSRGAA